MKKPDNIILNEEQHEGYVDTEYSIILKNERYVPGEIKFGNKIGFVRWQLLTAVKDNVEQTITLYCIPVAKQNRRIIKQVVKKYVTVYNNIVQDQNSKEQK